MSRILIVTGMHRSGTSLINSLFQQAGVHVGEQLLGPDRSNPRGYFEDLDFYRFHEDALRARGQNILVTPDFVFEPTLEESKRANALVESRADLPLWGWKDPRTSLFLDFWSPLVADAVYVFVYRHPFDVLASMLRRVDLHSPGLLEVLEAWQTYNFKIRKFYERHRKASVLCHAYGVVEQIESFSSLLKRKLNLELNLTTETLDALYRPDEFRRIPIPAELEQVLERIHPGMLDLYAELQATADLPFTSSDENAESNVDFSRLQEFIHALPPSLPISQRRGLLLMLFSQVDPSLTENFYVSYMQNVMELERMLLSLQEWNDQLTKGKAWLEEQHLSLQAAAEEGARVYHEQHAYIKELEQQVTHWRRLAEEREQYIRALEGRTQIKILTGLGMLPRYEPESKTDSTAND